MSDEPMLTTADMLEIFASGGNGSEYVDGVGLILKAAAELRANDAEIARLRAALAAAVPDDVIAAARAEGMREAAGVMRTVRAIYVQSDDATAWEKAIDVINAALEDTHDADC